MTVRVSVDPMRCRGSQTCITFSGGVFEWPDGSEAAVAKTDVLEDDDLIEQAREAAESCPTAAIILTEI